MSMMYCVYCDKQIDTDYNAEHFEECELENDDTLNSDYVKDSE